jgi:hypothetical protein
MNVPSPGIGSAGPVRPAVHTSPVRVAAAMHSGSAAVHPASASAAVHPASPAMHAAAATVARSSAAAPAPNLKEQTIIHLSGNGSRSVQFNCLRLRRCKAQQCCDRDPSADRSWSFHSIPP